MHGNRARVLWVIVAGTMAVSPGAGQPLPGQAPKRIASASPVYPAAVARLHLRGPVVVRLTVGPKGRVESATAVRGNRLLVGAAVAATRKWRFEPTGQRRRLLAAVNVRPSDPKIDARVSPPPLALRASGRVAMTLTIDTQGHVSDAVAWYGPEDAKVEALEAALRWETEPLVVDGAPSAFECPSQWWSDGSGAIRLGAVLPSLRCVTAEPTPAAASIGRPAEKIAIVEVAITSRGTVSHTTLLRSGSIPDGVALEAAGRMRFGPMFVSAVPIPVIVTVVIPATGAETRR